MNNRRQSADILDNNKCSAASSGEVGLFIVHADPYLSLQSENSRKPLPEPQAIANRGISVAESLNGTGAIGPRKETPAQPGATVLHHILFFVDFNLLGFNSPPLAA